jgi:4'-phosphopantetheinyl transferase
MAEPDAFFALPPPPLPVGAILCVGARLGRDAEGWISAAAPFATPGEREHAGRFLHASDAARHLLGRALARRTLAAVGLPPREDFASGPLGKPALPARVLERAGRLDFSISHSGDMVWTAFCREARVGIDVERLRPLPDLPGIAARLHPLECADILALAEPERTAAFYRCWTRKEAVLKALGQGLALPLSCFRVRRAQAADGWAESLPGGADPSGWTLRDIGGLPGHQCSVAGEAPGLGLSVFLDGRSLGL